MGITAKGIWTIRERDPESGEVVGEKTVHNILTNFGLSALAAALSGSYTPPLYLAIENFTSALAAPVNIGDTQVQLTTRVDISGDTQLVLSVGGSNQEIVTYTGVTDTSGTGAGPFVYALSAAVVNSHPKTDLVCRNVNVTDTMSSVQSEQEYDHNNFPGLRTESPGGYSSEIGNWTVQFYISAQTTLQNFVICGLTDDPNIGAGNLHNHFVLGYFRNGATNDIEIDGSVTIANG